MNDIGRRVQVSRAAILWMTTIWLCLCQPWSTGLASAQARGISAEELSTIIETLENDQEREQFLNKLRALLAANDSATRAPTQSARPEANFALSAVADKIAVLGAEFETLAEIFGNPRQAGKWLVDQVETPGRRNLWIEFVIRLAITILVGVVVGFLVHRLLARPRKAVEEREPPALAVKVPLLLARTLLDLLPVIAFAVAAFLTIAAIAPSAVARIAILAVVNAIVVSRGLVVVLRMLFTPLAPSLRLFDLSDRTAVYAYVWLKRLVNVPVYGFFLLQAALALGFPAEGYAGLLKLVGLLEAILFVVIALQMRETVAAVLRPRTPSQSQATRAWDGLRGRIAEVWHILCTFYVMGVYLIWALEVPGGFVFVARATAVTIVIVFVARLAKSVASRTVPRLFRVSGDLRQRYPQIEQRTNRYLPLIARFLSIVIYAVAGLLILQTWNIDMFAWLQGESGRSLISRAFSIALVLLGALAVWESVGLFISIYLERADSEDSSVTAGARVRTLLPLAKNALLIVILSVVTLTVLSELGVNIGPLLAGAGVAGLAIGFGAQTLVKDIITGAFILLEDQIAVGDFVSVGGYSGVVEGLTVRTISLRDLHGHVHVVPFSVVTNVTNFTKDFSYAVIDAGVAYRENTDEVTRLLEEIGMELRGEPEFAQDLPEPLEVFGVQELADSAVVIRVRLKTAPGRQWAVSREFNRRMKLKFDAHGIEIPFPHQTVYFGEDKDGQAPPLQVSRPRTATARSDDRPEPQGSQRNISNTPDDSGG